MMSLASAWNFSWNFDCTASMQLFYIGTSMHGLIVWKLSLAEIITHRTGAWIQKGNIWINIYFMQFGYHYNFLIYHYFYIISTL